MAPMGVVYAGRPGALNVRTADISVLGGAGLRHELSAYGVSSLRDVLRIQTQKTLEAFVYTGETSQQYGHNAPLLDPWTGALFVAGVGAFALRFRHPAYFLISTWFWITLVLGSVFTVDAPFSPHLVGMLPLLASFPALFFESGWQSAKRLSPRWGNGLFAVAAVGIVGMALVANTRDYLEVHVVRLQPAGFAALLGRYVLEINDRYRVYLISWPQTSLHYETTRFLAPDVDGIDLGDGPIAPPPAPPGKGMAFIVQSTMPAASERLVELRQRYPSGLEEAHRSTRGDVLFTSYLVGP
jgi:hypothetical protein